MVPAMRVRTGLVVSLGLLPLSLLALATGCTEATPPGADARATGPDARTGNGIPDASGIRPDAMTGNQPDAMPMVECMGADSEPNDSKAQATNQGTISDCDDEGGSATGSVISGNEDWFTFDATDNTIDLCSINPTATITGNVQACLYFECNSGSLDLGCPTGTMPQGAGGGPTGCCSANSFEVSDYNCTGTASEASQVHIQITATSTDTCEEYTVAYHF